MHGFIRFNAIEQALIDSPPFQRLHHIRQLGISFLVYPGATHTRFEHSLGTMEVATRIFEHLLQKEMLLDDVEYWKQILRLAALCHDLGHLPFSHDAEAVLLGKKGHEQWTIKIIRSPLLQPVWDMLSKTRNVAEDIVHIAVGLDKPCESWKKILCEIITADFFGADRIDYLLRDAKCTGVSYGTFDYHQLIEMLRILPQGDSLQLGIDGNGIESCESLLLARHFMHQRVYNYSTVQAHKFHLRHFMQAYYAQGDYLTSIEGYLSQSDNEILAALRTAAAAGNMHAESVIKREKRFRPIEIDPLITQETLREIQHRLEIPDASIFWNLSKKVGERGLSFPVLMPSGSIVDAAHLSQIRIPSHQKNWVFVSPDHEQSLKLEMERCRHV